MRSRNLNALVVITGALVALPFAQAVTTVIPANSFSSYSTFETYWNYLYPWGSDHNGSARMKGRNAYTISGEFSAPVARGTWPAFWLTVTVLIDSILIILTDFYSCKGVNSWPPEVDIGEWKGTSDNWFNTFNTSSIVRSDLVSWPSDLSFHSIKAVLTAQPNNADVKIEFYMDNVLRATQYGQNFVGQPLWLIVNLQMEGSSGSPGPTGTTMYKVRNIAITRTGS
ncbi:hypothetical protein H0H81_007815 [Sphagnurus paluster]|uniref:GH16 domain-containing protein n=1 Tax=Sphagnurus paluster TaxID=117069 RepID=A0A9P7GJB1_9AGAR|nr:hypothetical protein H0H81_007815 [Sphagnurus paluster]